MKTFDTFEEVEGLKPCKKRPVVVKAIQINEPFRVNSLEGDYKQGKAGDYLIKGIDGENYICDKAIFEKTYDFIDAQESNLKKLIESATSVKTSKAVKDNIENVLKYVGLKHTHVHENAIKHSDNTYTFELISATADTIGKRDTVDKSEWLSKLRKFKEEFNRRYSKTFAEIVTGNINTDAFKCTINLKFA